MTNTSAKNYVLINEILLDDLEMFINKIDDLNRYGEPITQEKWEHLLFYYFEPLARQYEEAINIYT